MAKSVQTIATAHFIFLATLCQQAPPIYTDDDDIIISRVPPPSDPVLPVFLHTHLQLPDRLREHKQGDWTASTQIFVVKNVELIVAFRKTNVEHEMQALLSYLKEPEKFKPLQYKVRVLGSRREIKANLEEVLLRDDQHKTCAICLEDVLTESKVEQLQACKHEFHGACIRKWLDRSPFCPLCRKSGLDLQD